MDLKPFKKSKDKILTKNIFIIQSLAARKPNGLPLILPNGKKVHIYTIYIIGKVSSQIAKFLIVKETLLRKNFDTKMAKFVNIFVFFARIEKYIPGPPLTL